jgi:hypothetical protein
MQNGRHFAGDSCVRTPILAGAPTAKATGSTKAAKARKAAANSNQKQPKKRQKTEDSLASSVVRSGVSTRSRTAGANKIVKSKYFS